MSNENIPEVDQWQEACVHGDGGDIQRAGDELVAALKDEREWSREAEAGLWKVRDECAADRSAPEEFRERIWSVARDLLERRKS